MAAIGTLRMTGASYPNVSGIPSLTKSEAAGNDFRRATRALTRKSIEHSESTIVVKPQLAASRPKFRIIRRNSRGELIPAFEVRGSTEVVESQPAGSSVANAENVTMKSAQELAMKTTPIAQDDKSRDKTRRPRRTASLASTPASSSTRKRGHAVLEVSNDESPISTKEQLRSRKRSNTEENIMREGMREGVRTRATLQKDVVLAMPETSLSRPAKRRSIDSPKHAKSRLLKLIYKSKSGEVDADSTACAQPPTSAPASDAATQQPSSACPAGVNGSTSLTPPASSTQESSSLSSPEQARSHSFAEKRPLDTEQRLQQLRAWAEDKHYLSEDDRRDLRAWAGFIIKRDIGVMKGRIKHHDKYNRALEYLGFDREGRVTVRVTVDVSHD